jgi:DNA topoisomerase I
MPGNAPKSAERVSKSLDKPSSRTKGSKDNVQPGISLRFGPVDDMDVDDNGPQTNGLANGKRKSRASVGTSKTYKEASSESEDDKPLV